MRGRCYKVFGFFFFTLQGFSRAAKQFIFHQGLNGIAIICCYALLIASYPSFPWALCWINEGTKVVYPCVCTRTLVGQRPLQKKPEMVDSTFRFSFTLMNLSLAIYMSICALHAWNQAPVVTSGKCTTLVIDMLLLPLEI